MWAYNTEINKVSLQEVIHLVEGKGYKTLSEIKLENDENITATSNHLFFNPDTNKWKPLKSFTADDPLFSFQMKTINIKEKRNFSNKQSVYNISIANDHNYFVGFSKILTHNTGCKLNRDTIREHTFSGRIINGGINGLHHIGNLDNNGRGITADGFHIQTHSGTKPTGFYKAQVSKDGVISDKTMFPIEMSEDEVMDMIDLGFMGAMANKDKNSFYGKKKVKQIIKTMKEKYPNKYGSWTENQFGTIKLRYICKENNCVSVFGE